MKKLLAPVTGAISYWMIFAQSALAQLPEDQIDDITGLEDETDIATAIVDFIETVLTYILIIAVIFVIVAGIRLIVSGGDEGEKDKAKKTIIYVIVGIIVILFARVIVSFVNNLVTGATP